MAALKCLPVEQMRWMCCILFILISKNGDPMQDTTNLGLSKWQYNVDLQYSKWDTLPDICNLQIFTCRVTLHVFSDLYRLCGNTQAEAEGYQLHDSFTQSLLQDHFQSTQQSEHKLIQVNSSSMLFFIYLNTRLLIAPEEFCSYWQRSLVVLKGLGLVHIKPFA